MAEQARKKEEQLLLERKLKKEELERQREAARRAAVQPVPAQKEGDVGAKAAACLAPSSTSGLAAAARAPEGAAKATALPRLKQAMEVRPFLQPSRPLVRRTRYCATGSRTVERVAPPKPGAGKQGAYLALAPRVCAQAHVVALLLPIRQEEPAAAPKPAEPAVASKVRV